jgi:hypothetical protein
VLAEEYEIVYFFVGIGMAQTYTVTASTSVVLISTLQSPHTIVYLSSVSYPGHIVGIRYTSSSANIINTPIIVSTTQGISFYDGTFSTLINQPLGSVSIASRGPTGWQVLNNQGFTDILSNAYLNSMSSTWAFANTVSSVFEAVSTIQNVAFINVSKNFVALGTNSFQGTITIGNTAYFFSTAITLGNANISTGMIGRGPVTMFSTLSIGGPLSLIDTGSVTGDLIVGNTLFVQNTLALQQGAILPRNFSTLSMTTDTLTVGSGIQVAGTLSVGTSLTTLGSVSTTGSMFVYGNVTQGTGDVRVGKDLTVMGPTEFKSIYTEGTRVLSEVYTNTVEVTRSLSSLGSLFSVSSISVSGPTLLQDSLYVSSQVLVHSNVGVAETFYASSIRVSNQLDIGGYLFTQDDTIVKSLSTSQDVYVGGSLFVTGSTFIQGSISTLQSFAVWGDYRTNNALVVNSNVFIEGALSTISSLSVEGTVSGTSIFMDGTVYLSSNLGVGGIFSTASISATTQLIRATNLKVKSYVTTSSLNAHTLRTFNQQFDGPVYIATEAFNAPNFSTLDLVVGGSAYIGSTIFISSFLKTPSINTSSFIVEGTGLLLGNSTTTITNLYTQSEQTFSTTGTYTVPSNINSLLVYLWGAGGGGCGDSNNPGLPTAGAGAFVTGYLTVTPSESLNILVGGAGQWNGTVSTVGGGGAGEGAGKGSSGGGRSAVQRAAADLVTAGGGGGAAAWNSAGYGLGGAATYSGVSQSGTGARLSGGAGGSQVAGGAGGASNTVPYGSAGTQYYGGSGVAGGGGGYYGGGGAGYDITGGPAGGGAGSSYITDPAFRFIFGYNSPDGTSAPGTNVPQYQSGVAKGGEPFLNGGPGLVVIKAITSVTERFSSLQVGPYVHLESRFHSSIVSPSINNPYYSTNTSLFVSSITASYFYGDGTYLSNLTNYQPTSLPKSIVATSSFYTDTFYANSAVVKTNSFQYYQQLGNTIASTSQFSISTITFVSSIDLMITTAFDLNENNIAYNLGNTRWNYANRPMMDGYAIKVATNSNADDPLLVAVGQSSNPLRTILWSRNGSNWNNIVTGGFDSGGGNDITYSPELGRWIAVGEDTRGSIQYSSDGSNWNYSSNGFLVDVFPNFNNSVRWNPTTSNFVAVTTYTLTNPLSIQIKTSSNGINWLDLSGYYNSSNQFINTELSFNYTSPVLSYGYYNDGVIERNNVWYIVYMREYTSFSPYRTLYSVNGTTWYEYAAASNALNALPFLFNGTLFALNYIEDIRLWYIGGETTYFSSDFRNWLPTTLSSSPYYYSFNRTTSTIYSGVASFIGNNFRTTQGVNFSTFFSTPSELGFSTGIEAYGFPTGFFTGPNTLTADSYSTNSIFVYGTRSKNFITRVGPVFMPMVQDTLMSLPIYFFTPYDVINIFSTSITSMAYSATPYNFDLVVTGDSRVSQQTIARASNLNVYGQGYPGATSQTFSSFVPALIGGFSTCGYGVTYYNPNYEPNPVWLAVGDANVGQKTIQVSQDAINWYPTNNDKGVRYSARSITWGNFQGTNKIIVTGSDEASNRCILVGDNTYTNWRSTIGVKGFSGKQANAAVITPDYCVVTGNRDINSSENYTETIKYSADTVVWRNVESGGFSNGGYGLAAKITPYAFVAGGSSKLGNQGTDTIKYSYDGQTWYNSISGNNNAVYKILWADYLKTYFAGGSYGMNYSKDGKYWYTLSTIYTGACESISLVPDPYGKPMIWAGGYKTGLEAFQSNYMTSYDGIYWSTVYNPFISPKTSNTVAYSSRSLVMFSNKYYMNTQEYNRGGESPFYSIIRYSTDFDTWSNTDLIPSQFTRIQCGLLESGYTNTGAQILVAGCTNSPYDPYYTMYYSLNGINFSPVTTPNTYTSDMNLCALKWVNTVTGPKWLAVQYRPTQIWYSSDGQTWILGGSVPGFFASYPGGLTYNQTQARWYLTGASDTNPSYGKMIYSDNGINWYNINTVGNTVLSNSLNFVISADTTSKTMPALSSIIVAVGDSGFQSRSNIQWSYDGGIHFSTGASTFFGRATGVIYNEQRSSFFVTGTGSESITSDTLNIFQMSNVYKSDDGADWMPVNSDLQTAPFNTQVAVGISLGFTTQRINYTEQFPTMTISTFTLYDRPQAFDGFRGSPTLRLTSSYLTFNETLYTNLSTQVMINTDTPYLDSALTVMGRTYADNVNVVGTSFTVANNFTVSSLTLSTLVLYSSLVSEGSIQSPYLSFNGTQPIANSIAQSSGLIFNNLLLSSFTVGVNQLNPSYMLNVNGTAGTNSTIVNTIVSVRSSISFISGTYKSTLLNLNNVFGITENRQSVNTSNTLYSLSNGISFNNIAFVTLSSQCIGIGTSTPQYNFEVQYPTIIQGNLISLATTIGALRPSIQYF